MTFVGVIHAVLGSRDGAWVGIGQITTLTFDLPKSGQIKSGATIASDWGRTTGRIADRLAEAGLPKPRPIVIHGGDTDATVRGVSLVPWTAIGRLVAGSNDQERP
jgi:hypothetical protein